MTSFGSFLSDESGAVTVDWVALTAGLLLLGIVLVLAIYNNGVASSSSTINAQLSDTGSVVTTPTTPITTATFR